MRVVLDTNVLISLAIGSRALKPIEDAWRAGRFTLLTSSYLLFEVKAVLARPKFTHYLTADQAARFVSRLETLSEAISIKQPFPEFSDAKDRFLLAMVRHQADILVTGDGALLALEHFETAVIISPRAFIDLLAEAKEK
jgi:putative PIN family toxin of toxin-antitoxin system